MPVTIEIQTQSPHQVIDITERVGAAIASGLTGACHLYLKHTTAAVTVMTWESGVPEDIMDIFQTLTPKLAYRHDSPAHVAAPLLDSAGMTLRRMPRVQNSASQNGSSGTIARSMRSSPVVGPWK